MTPLNSGPHIKPSRELALEARIAELEDEVAELRAMLAVDADTEALRLLGFTATEARIVNLLLARDKASRDQVLFAMYPNNPDKRYDMSYGLPSVHMTRIRAVLKPLGATVKAFWGEGWWMTPESKDALRRALKRPCRAAAE